MSRLLGGRRKTDPELRCRFGSEVRRGVDNLQKVRATGLDVVRTESRLGYEPRRYFGVDRGGRRDALALRQQHIAGVKEPDVEIAPWLA